MESFDAPNTSMRLHKQVSGPGGAAVAAQLRAHQQERTAGGLHAYRLARRRSCGCVGSAVKAQSTKEARLTRVIGSGVNASGSLAMVLASADAIAE